MKLFKEFLRAFCWLFTISIIVDSLLKTLETGESIKPVLGYIIGAAVFGLFWVAVYYARQKEKSQPDKNQVDK